MNVIFLLSLILINDLDAVWGQDYFEIMNEQPRHNSKSHIFINNYNLIYAYL